MNVFVVSAAQTHGMSEREKFDQMPDGNLVTRAQSARGLRKFYVVYVGRLRTCVFLARGPPAMRVVAKLALIGTVQCYNTYKISSVQAVGASGTKHRP